MLDKPPGLPSHPPEASALLGQAVASLAVHLFGDLPVPGGADPGIVHRLDRDTSTAPIGTVRTVGQLGFNGGCPVAS